MLYLYSPNRIPKDREIVKLPWLDYFEINKVTQYLDETDAKIVEDVEDTHLINNQTILSKFRNIPIDIGKLSEGCKTLLCINHAIKTNMIQNYIFNITSCGDNAIQYIVTTLASDVDIYAYSYHGNLGYFNNVELKINDELFNNSAYAAREFIDTL